MGDGGGVVQWMGGESEGSWCWGRRGWGGSGKGWVLGDGGKKLHIIMGSRMFRHLFATCLGQSH